MTGTQRPWMLVLPLSVLGMAAGHSLAYRVTDTPAGPYHDYVAHLPRVALVLLVLAVVAAHFVGRGVRLALWPFPAVAVAGFVVQEHAERLEHTRSVPLLLTSRVFLVGLGAQLVIAILVWLVARLLVVVAHLAELRRSPISSWTAGAALGWTRLAAAAPPLGVHSRAPPHGR